MKLEALHSIKGLKPNDEYTHAGETFEIEPKEGQRLIDLGSAVEVTEEAEEEAEEEAVEETPQSPYAAEMEMEGEEK